MPRLTNICVFLACVLMLYSATYLSNPVPRRRAQPSVDPGEVPAATDDEIARVRRQLDEAQRREERARELLRATQEQASRTGPAPVVPVAVPAVVPSGPSERPAAAARQVNAGIVLDGTLEAALGLAAPRGPGFLMLTFSNSALKDHLYNFVAHAKEVAAAHVVGAVDVETFDLLREMTSVYKTPLAASSFQMDGSNQHSSGSWKKFAMMRTGEVARLVGLGYSVLHTDIDVIWLRDPSPYLMCTAEAQRTEFSAASRWPCAPMRQADVAVSSDNMSPGRDTEGHAAYAAGGTFNTGILFIRANPQGKAFASAWHANVARPARGTRFFSDTSDQQVFNHMMRDPSFWPGISAPQGEHVMKTYFDKAAGQVAGAQPSSFLLGALPMALFMNGHGYFVGSAHQKLGVKPFAAHATYSLDRHDGLAKRQRFREAGLWRSDPDAYFQGRFLALNASVAPAVQRAIASYAAGAGNNIGVHALALASHLSELRDGLALARALRRTLVLPRWLCYCDRLWSPSDDIFHFGCMYPGAQDGKFLPFVCPMDHVLSPTDWAQEPYRDAAFLDSPRVPAATRSSLADVHLMPRAQYDALPPGGRQHALPLGVTDSEAVGLLRPLDQVSVLRIPHARRLLCGIEDAAERSRFNSDAARLLRVPPWGAKCFQPCSSELAKWLTPEQISSGGGARGNFWTLHVKPPPPFKAGTCVRNMDD